MVVAAVAVAGHGARGVCDAQLARCSSSRPPAMVKTPELALAAAANMTIHGTDFSCAIRRHDLMLQSYGGATIWR